MTRGVFDPPSRPQLPILHVLVIPDGGMFFAQGLEVDYASNGETINQTIEFFLNGLHATAEAHIKGCGHLKGLIKPSPEEVWLEFMNLLGDPHAIPHGFKVSSRLLLLQSKLWIASASYSTAFFLIKETP